MSELSARISSVKRNRRSPWPSRWAEIADRLVATHGAPTLGNFKNPVKEIFYILLSAKTADAQYRRTNKALHAAYPTLEALAAAKVKGIRVCIESGGLAATRAGQIVALAKALLKTGAPIRRDICDRSIPRRRSSSSLVCRASARNRLFVS